jgi:hypothetical protein
MGLNWKISGTNASVGTPVQVSTKFGDQNVSSYVSLSVEGANCVLKGRELSATSAAACTVTAKSTGYFGAQTFNFIQPVDQAPLSLTNTSFTTSYLGSFSLSASGGSGNGPVSINTSGCTLGTQRYGTTPLGTSPNNPSTLRAYGPGTCTVWASKAASPGFKAATSAAMKFTFTPIEAESLIIQYQVAGGAKAESMAIGEGALLQTNDDSGRAPQRFSVSGANCSLGVGNYVRATSATTCVVTAARDGYEIKKRWCFNDGECREDWWQYGASTSAPVSFVFDYRDQAPLFIYNPVTTTTAPFVYLISMGGSGTGATTYSVSGASCSISGTGSNAMLNATAPATCVVTATKAASPIGYRSAVNSPPKTFYFTKP